MNTAEYVDSLVISLKEKKVPIQDAVWETALACVGWPYTFGAEGRLTTKDGIKVRTFDCQGFTEWCLSQFGVNIKAAGCTSQWNNESLWAAKGDISNVPNDTLVCLFHRSKDEPSKMAHTGFGFRGATCECQVGVQYFAQRKSKWQYWAIPKGTGGAIPEPSTHPTLRRGDKGEYVTLLQTELIQRGYDLGKWGADGSYGAQTAEAVKAFQKDSGLTADGICGPKTWAALEGEQPTRYTVTIPHMTRSAAEALTAQYSGATMTEEGA